MRITKTSLTNVKGVSGVFDFGAATLICGPNATGKTAILDSIRLSMLGYHPKLGKQNKSIFAISSGINMETSVIMDTGELFSFALALEHLHV